MRFGLWLRELERKHIVSRHPHPLLLFILTLLILYLGTESYIFSPTIGYLLFGLGGFTFIFSILHWLVWMHLTKKPLHRTHSHYRKK